MHDERLPIPGWITAFSAACLGCLMLIGAHYPAIGSDALSAGANAGFIRSAVSTF